MIRTPDHMTMRQGVRCATDGATACKSLTKRWAGFGRPLFRVLENGPARASVKASTSYGASTVDTDWLLHAESRTRETRGTLDGLEVLVIPANVPHSALALEDADDLEIFSPIRVDWLTSKGDYFRQK
jgi:hypothetical protein